MSIINIPVQHTVSISIEKLIAHNDSTQLNELILLADRKLSQMEYVQEPVKKEAVNYIGDKPVSISKY